MVVAGGLLAAGPATVRADEPAPIDFRRDIQPLLADRCFDCHAGSDNIAGRRLDVRSDLLGYSDGVAVVVAGDSAASRLIAAVTTTDPRQRMPPPDAGDALTAAEVARLRAWIDQGLAWDERLLPEPTVATEHWAFQPVERPPPPQIESPALRAWSQTPIDAFIAAAYEAHGLAPSPPASRATLVRRLYFDLLGMPPTAAELAAALADDGPDAYERLVEQLLASPQYGVRWGRHWLDVARWAESEGYESNHVRPYAWRYRDWVVDSFNADRPYDDFLRRQIAGDELAPYDDANLIATGFLAAARLSSNEESKPLQVGAVLVDIVNALGESVLGLTISCAECHNHKFDPISLRDYYQLQAFFVRGAPNNLALADEALWSDYRNRAPAEYEPLVAERDALLAGSRARLEADIRAQLTTEQRAALDTPDAARTPAQLAVAREADLRLQLLESQLIAGLTKVERARFDELRKRIEEIEKKLGDKPQTWGFFAPASAPRGVEVLPMKGFYPPPYEPRELSRRQAYLLIRGDLDRRGPAVEPAWPAVFGGADALTDPQLAARPRTALANWLTDRRHPLTARVWVNRLWQWHFGRGLVATSGDFGLRGDRPSHPELLDWLAAELVASGWSTKHLHRQLVTSSVYRLSSTPSDAAAAIDPENRYWWRFSPRRLEAEAIRDAALAAADRLDAALGGPADGSDREAASRRRTLYLRQIRDRLPEVQRLFDGASANEACSRRHVSTVALQPLYLLNSRFWVEQAEALARRVEREVGSGDPVALATAAFERAVGRTPGDNELAALVEFLVESSEDEDDTTPAAERPAPQLVRLCHTLLNLNEFVYLD